MTKSIVLSLPYKVERHMFISIVPILHRASMKNR